MIKIYKKTVEPFIGSWVVETENTIADALCWDEMLVLVASLTIPSDLSKTRYQLPKDIEIKRDKDGFMVGDPSDLGIYLPFEIHDAESDTWELVEDSDNLIDWGSDIDTKPCYDKIRLKGGKQ